MIIPLPLPRTGSTSSDRATVIAWHVAVGSSITVGQAIADVETDKSVVSVESSLAGVVTQLCVDINDEAEIGQVLLLVDDGTAGQADAPLANVDELQAATAQPVAPQAPTAHRDDLAISNTPGLRATPAARRRGRELGIDLTTIAPGSGPMGRVEVADVERAATNLSPRTAGASAPPAWASNLKGNRRTIALRMAAAAADVVPVTLFRNADVTSLHSWMSAQSMQANLLDALLAIVAHVLPRYPAVNAHLDERGLINYSQVNLGYAVDGSRGLVVPVIRDAHRLNLAELADRRRALVTQALSGSLPADAQDNATFTVSNLGAFGVSWFTPLVSPPQVAILGLGAVIKKFEPRADGTVERAHRIPLSLTFDHRAVDGAPAARFLAALADALAAPVGLLT